MKILPYLACGLLLGLAGALPAQVGPAERILKERARGATNDVTQRSGNPAYTPPAKTRPPTPAPPAPPVAAPAIPELTGNALAAARKLRKDLEAIGDKGGAPGAHTQTLTQDLLQAATGPKQPPLNSVLALAGDLAAAWPAQKFSDAEKDQFTHGIVHVLNSHQLPPAATQRVLLQTDALLKKSGIGEADSKRIATGLKNLAAQMQR